MKEIRIQPFYIAGLSVRTTNENNQMMTDIPALWQRFISENIASQLSSKLSSDVYCIYTNYESDHTKPYTVHLGCRVSDAFVPSDGLTTLYYEGGKYRRFAAKGDLQQGAVYQTWLNIWEADIDRAYSADFEIYGAKAADQTNAEVDILIAVK